MMVKPFKGLRPSSEFVEKVQAPPYDVVTRKEIKELIKNNPHSFLHITRPDAELPDSIDEHDPQVYQKARENLQKFINDKILIRDDEAAFYLNAQTWKGRTQIGLYAAVSCEQYLRNEIKKHEFTRPDKEQDRTTHLKTLQANTGPVFLLFRDTTNYHTIIESTLKSEALYDFTDENEVRNRFWPIREKSLIQQLENYFDSLPALYIADGHHRAASAGNLYREMKEKFPEQSQNAPWSRFMAVLFPASQLAILPYNRLILDNNKLSLSDLLNQIKEKWEVKESQDLSAEAKKIGMYVEDRFFVLSPKANTWKKEDPVSNLDVSILQDNLLSPILNIQDPRTSPLIRFVGGIKGNKALVDAVNKGEAKIAFSLHPVSVEELMIIADHNQTMPPKSTWFEPKLRSGLVTHLLDS